MTELNNTSTVSNDASIKLTPAQVLVSDTYLKEYEDDPIRPEEELPPYIKSMVDVPANMQYIDYYNTAYERVFRELARDSDSSYTVYNNVRVYGVRLSNEVNLKNSALLNRNNNVLSQALPTDGQLATAKEYLSRKVELLTDNGWVEMAPSLLGLCKVAINQVTV